MQHGEGGGEVVLLEHALIRVDDREPGVDLDLPCGRLGDWQARWSATRSAGRGYGGGGGRGGGGGGGLGWAGGRLPVRCNGFVNFIIMNIFLSSPILGVYTPGKRPAAMGWARLTRPRGTAKGCRSRVNQSELGFRDNGGAGTFFGRTGTEVRKQSNRR